MGSWFYRQYYTPTAPRKVKGGIKSQTKRGAFGQSWWAKRWIAVLEGFDIGARLGRGRSYARQGQVISISVDKGQVTAAVQGSRARPYDVAIQVKALSEAEWSKILTALSGQAIFGAKLLAGEMPDDIETVFQEQKLSLFPRRLADLKTNCSCPDWSNPCKHVAAVYYLLGEEFDRDPFLIFKLRGLDRDEVVSRLGSSSCLQQTTIGEKTGLNADMPKPTEVSALEPLPAEPEAFWRSPGGDWLPDTEILLPTLPAAMVKRLGSFPLWRGSEPFIESLERFYAAASHRGLNVYLGSQEIP